MEASAASVVSAMNVIADSIKAGMGYIMIAVSNNLTNNKHVPLFHVKVILLRRRWIREEVEHGPWSS